MDVLLGGLTREIPAPELHEWLRRSTETLRLRAAVVTTTWDQLSGLCRELRDDFGLEPDGVLADDLRDDVPPLAVRRADLIVTTQAHAARVRRLAEALRKTAIVVEVRPDLVVGEWAMLLRQPVYAVVASPEFGDMLRRFFADTPGVENLRVLVLGRDDLSAIPDGAPTYLTRRVRDTLGDARIPGRILPAARTISTPSAREILRFVVRSNVDALARVGR